MVTRFIVCSVAIVATLVSVKPTRAQEEPNQSQPNQSQPHQLSSFCLLMDQIAATGPCCTMTRGELAETTGVHMGRFLARVAGNSTPSRPTSPRPIALAPAVVADSNVADNAGEKALLLLAQIEIEATDASGKTTVLSRPHVLAVEGETAKIEIADDDGEAMSIQIKMRQVTGAPAEAVQPERPASPLEGKIYASPAELDSAPQESQVEPGRAVAEFDKALPIVIPSELGLDFSTAPESYSPLPNATWRPAPTATGRHSATTTPRVAKKWESVEPIRAEDDPYFTRKALYEGLYEKKIASLLSHIPNLKVAVEVTLDSRLHSASEQIENAVGGGVVTTVEERSPLLIEDVTVSVAFPDDYVVQVWDAQRVDEQPPTVNELDQVMAQVETSIETLVSNVLPRVGAGMNPFPRVAVRSYTSVRQQPVLDDAAQPVSLAKATPTMSSVAAAEVEATTSSTALWVLGAIGFSLLCGSIGAAILFHRVPAPPHEEPHHSNDSLMPPRRRAA